MRLRRIVDGMISKRGNLTHVFRFNHFNPSFQVENVSTQGRETRRSPIKQKMAGSTHKVGKSME